MATTIAKFAMRMPLFGRRFLELKTFSAT